MKKTLFTATPLLALATIAFGQIPSTPIKIREENLFAVDQQRPGNPPAEARKEIAQVAAPATVTASGETTFAITIKKAMLPAAVEQVQGMLDETGQTRINLLMSVPNPEGLKVPDLTLRKVQGPDALALIATSVGCELKPIFRVGEEQTVIGWEIRPVAKENRLYFNATRAGGGTLGVGSSGGAAPGGNVLMAVGPTSGGGTSISGYTAPPQAVESGVGPVRVPLGGDLGGGLIVATPLGGSGTLGGAPGGDVLLARPVTERITRVYPLGTVTSYVKFAEVEQSLRDLFNADGVGAGEVKMSLHDKTNILVVNGTERVQALVGQAVSALAKDAAVRDAQQSGNQARELKDTADRLMRELKDRQAQIDELRKASQDSETRRMKLESELLSLKSELKVR